MTRLLNRLHQRFLELDTLFRARALRERLILGGGLAALLFFAFDTTLIQPIATERERIRHLTAVTEEEIGRLERDREALERVELSPEELDLLRRRRQAEEELALVNREIASEIEELVPPEAIVSVLEEMLAPFGDLRLVRITSEPPHRVGSGALHESESGLLDATGSLYRHGLRVEIEGSFAATVEYIEAVERSPWHLLWDRLEYRVAEYPSARVTIELHTVSEQEEWIGV
ncbi:MAG: hypothetical protein AAGC67_00265 [Myxococcota bacterium]